MKILKFKSQQYHRSLTNSEINNFILDKNNVFFSKIELTSILNLYSKQVSKGFWRDYAIDNQIDTAIFSIYKHSHDNAKYQIIKKSIKGYRNKPEFIVKKDYRIIIKSKEINFMLSRLENKLSEIKNN